MDNETQKVVIIDDEPTTLLLLESAVESLAKVVTVSQSANAFSVIKAQLPDLVVLDISMPELSGFEVCKQLKACPETAAIPVIFVTSHSDPENEHVALSLGAIDFISKPIDIGLCQMRVRNHLTIQDQKTKLARVNHELEAEKKQLAITLKSIADGVISINAAGDVTFVNPVAMSYSATLARVGGDEFACLLTEIGSGYSADSIAMACLQAGREPIDIDGKAHQLSLSIGISLYPQDAVNAEEMMRHADSAMYRSKSKGKDTFSFFSKDLQHAMHHRVEMEIKLRNAIENDSLAIYLQPKYNFDDSTVLSAESLVRMFDENGKVIGPDEFIPLAEETGLIHQLGKQVLQKSCDFVAKCNELGQDFKVAVNVAAKQLSNPGFAKEVAEIINEAGIAASSIELEVTESALMHDFVQTRDILNDLASLGVTIALDDFGTGYSSLSYLRQFPLNVLKIDRSFVIDMDKEQQAHDIVTAIVHLALSLELTIVAEGIETQSHFAALKALGCHLGQGYFMCRPMAMADFFTKFIDDCQVA